MHRVIEQFDAIADDGSCVRITCLEDYREQPVMGGKVVPIVGLKWYELATGEKLNYRDGGARFESVLGDGYRRVG